MYPLSLSHDCRLLNKNDWSTLDDTVPRVRYPNNGQFLFEIIWNFNSGGILKDQLDQKAWLKWSVRSVSIQVDS